MTKEEIAKLLGSSQSGGESHFETPQFLKNISLYLEAKKKDGVATFRYYDKASSTNKLISKPLDGILIGAANVLVSFSRRLGNNGASIRSTIYLDKEKDNVVLFGGGSKLFSGSVQDASSYIVSLGGVVKKRKILYVLTANGVISVETNISLFINEKNRIGETLKTHITRFTPSVYSNTDPDIHNNTKKALSSLANTNPPAYVKMQPLNEISGDYADVVNLLDVHSMYMDMVEYYKSLRGKTIDIEEEEEEVEQTAEESWAGKSGGQPTPPLPDNPPPPPEEEFSPTDDLPF